MFRRCAAAFLFLLFAGSSAWAGIPAACSQQPPSGDKANAVLAGSFTGTGQSTCFSAQGTFNIYIYGSGGPNGAWNASVQVERSVNGGTTWVVAGVGGGGQQAVYNVPNQDVSVQAFEPEAGVVYRFDCTSYTSGTINYRMSTTGGSATSSIWNP